MSVFHVKANFSLGEGFYFPPPIAATKSESSATDAIPSIESDPNVPATRKRLFSPTVPSLSPPEKRARLPDDSSVGIHLPISSEFDTTLPKIKEDLMDSDNSDSVKLPSISDSLPLTAGSQFSSSSFNPSSSLLPQISARPQGSEAPISDINTSGASASSISAVDLPPTSDLQTRTLPLNDSEGEVLDMKETDWIGEVQSDTMNGAKFLSGKLLQTYELDSVVCCVTFSANGKYLAAGCKKKVHIYDLNETQPT